jgi:hypothetical protein
MTTEKLQNLASCAHSAAEKVKNLKLWNNTKAQRMVNMFPIGPFNDSVFNSYLHRYVFWVQIRKAAMEDILPMTGPEHRTGVQPSIFFPSYIESCRIRNWDYAFTDLIEMKEIQKSFDWAKQIHAPQANSKSTAKSVLQAGQRARQVGSVSLGKRGLPPGAAEATKRSRVEEDHSAQFDPDEITHSHSQNKSSKSISHTTRSFGGSEWGYRSSVVCRDTGGKVFEELVLCSRVGSFLENSDLGHRFASFSAKVTGLNLETYSHCLQSSC